MALSDPAAFYIDRGRPETLKQMQHMNGDPFFRDYTKHPSWVALARSLVGEEANADSPEWFNKPPGTNSPTPPHQDNYYFCLNPPNVLTIWLALDPVDEPGTGAGAGQTLGHGVGEDPHPAAAQPTDRRERARKALGRRDPRR